MEGGGLGRLSRDHIFENLKWMRGTYSRKYTISVIKTEKDDIGKEYFFSNSSHMVTELCISTDLSIILV